MALTAAAPEALFVGLCTLDIIQRVDRVPAENEKLTAGRQTVAAGGPAANAAATFSYLGGSATLVTGVGRHALAAGIRADLDEVKVRVVDLAAERTTPPSVSSIIVTAASGARAVVSTLTAAGRRRGGRHHSVRFLRYPLLDGPTGRLVLTVHAIRAPAVTSNRGFRAPRVTGLVPAPPWSEAPASARFRLWPVLRLMGWFPPLWVRFRL